MKKGMNDRRKKQPTNFTFQKKGTPKVEEVWGPFLKHHEGG